jgi:hypothetical protein
MAGFLFNFTGGFRISLCAKQVYTEILSISSAQGARLALMTALFRAKMLNDCVPGSAVSIGDLVEYPMAFRKELCYATFCQLADIRGANREKIKAYDSFKVEPSQAIMKHTEVCNLALSLLMSTVGVGFKPATLQTVKSAWECLAAATPSTSDVTSIMSMPERVLSEIVEKPIAPDKWLEMARKRPDFLNTLA